MDTMHIGVQAQFLQFYLIAHQIELPQVMCSYGYYLFDINIQPFLCNSLDCI